MPDKLREYLPALSQEERDVLFGDIIAVTSRPMEDPVRQGVISGMSGSLGGLGDGADGPLYIAYSETMKIVLVLAAMLSVIPVVLSFFMPNWYLGDKQNAVDATDLKGERSHPHAGSGSKAGEDADAGEKSSTA